MLKMAKMSHFDSLIKFFGHAHVRDTSQNRLSTGTIKQPGSGYTARLFISM
ncbi:MAG: hypothetical protein RL013_2439 [Bacteroidota bacterium]|jgi:hypothetical protein